MKLEWLRNYNLLIFDSVDSTNSEALRLANAGVSGKFVITAREQSIGKGSKGRSWVSIPGNLHASILLTDVGNITKYTQLSFLTANAIYESIRQVAHSKNIKLSVKLKWPNDVLVNEKKIAGVLLESISLNNKNYVVIGIGVNIIEFPANTNFPATSLYDENIMLEHRDEFLFILMNKFDRLYRKWIIDNSFENIKKAWLSRAYKLNKAITFENNDKRVSGIFKTIKDDGSICIHVASGQLCSFVVGSILNS